MAEKIDLVSAEDFLLKLRQGVKEIYEIKARGLTLPVRILSIDESLDIRNRCTAENTAKGGDVANLGALIQKETLRVATTISKDKPAVPGRLFDLMSLDELSYIYNEYLRILEANNPGLEDISPERFRALVDVLKKKGDAEMLKDCSYPQLRLLAFNFILSIQDQGSQA